LTVRINDPNGFLRISFSFPFSCASRSGGTSNIVGGALWGKDLGSVESFAGSGFTVEVFDGCSGSLECFGEAG
jgi:hypothetical protein